MTDARIFPVHAYLSLSCGSTVEEAQGRLLLETAIDLDEMGEKTGWTVLGAKQRAVDTYVQAAEVSSNHGHSCIMLPSSTCPHCSSRG